MNCTIHISRRWTAAMSQRPSTLCSKCLSGRALPVLATIILALGPAISAAAEEEPTLEVTVGQQGLAAIQYAGNSMLADGAPFFRSVTLEKLDKKPEWEYRFEQADLSNPNVKVNGKQKQVVYGFPWGSARFAYRTRGDRLILEMTLDNTSDRTLANFEVQLLELQFPQRPGGGVANFGKVDLSFDKLAVVSVPYGKHKMLACVDTIFPPMHFGLDKASNEALTRFPVIARGGIPAMEPDGVLVHPHGLPRVEAGASRTFSFSFRFAPVDRPDPEIVSDLHKAFRNYWAPISRWKDNRFVGAIFLPTGGQGPENNPRNWFKLDVDVTTKSGQEELRTKVLKYADSAIKTLKRMDAQGMIAWNIEGGENPHPITYIGDPRMLPILAPEMDEIADEFFRKFREAGIRTGVCIRPTQVYQRDTSEWAHGTGSHSRDRNPLNESYDELWPEGLPWWRFFPVAERMIRKVEYAKERWGCTIFYIDTNGIRPPFKGGDRFSAHGADFTWVELDGHIWRRIAEAHPDVLLIPELRREEWTFHAAQWAYTTPYEQLDYTGNVSTPKWIRRIFPNGSVANYVANTQPERLEELHEELIEAVRRGDILMGRGWFYDAQNKRIKPVYEDARKNGEQEKSDETDAR